MREEYIYIGPGMIAKNQGPKSRDRNDIEPFSGNNDRPTNRTKDGHEGSQGSSTCNNVGAP